MRVYHIVLTQDWEQWNTELYRAKSLEAEGFIHCSFAEQLNGVVERYYAAEDEVVILEIESEALMSRLVNEPSTNDEIYPHIYGPINRDAIVSVRRHSVVGNR